MINKKSIGITFSHPHLEHLGLDVSDSLDKALSMNFSHLRIGAYWTEIEKEKNKFDFSKLEKIVKKCEKEKQPIILTVGVKAPRWPEFYWPEHIKEKNPNNKEAQEKIIVFIKKTIKKFKKYSCITHWQVENEPLDQSGPDNLSIPFEFLKREFDVVKKIDNRKIIINLWGNDLLNRDYLKKTEEIADIIGLDFYPKQFVKKIIGKSFYKNYTGIHQSKNKLIKTLKESKKPIWITELQAEPWEENEKGYFSKNPESISPQKLIKNIKDIKQLPVKEILLWGFEYWLWKEKNGDGGYLTIL
jgi:GH35 family endo-1,4-beta-xylanase